MAVAICICRAVLYMMGLLLSSRNACDLTLPYYGVGGAVGVKPGCGVRGVLVGGRVAVGVTRFTRIFRVWPT